MQSEGQNIRNKILTLLTVTLLLANVTSIMTLINSIPLAKADGPDPYLEVKPNYYNASKMETFNVSVWLNDITKEKRLIGVDFRLTYNSTLLQNVSVTEGPFLPSFPNKPDPPYTFFIYYWETDGLYGPHVVVGDQILPSNGEYTVFPEGSGIIATITFKGIFPKGSCALELKDIKLTDDKANLITTLDPKNGYYQILFGDVNGDGKVDIKDLSLASLAYGSYGPDGPKHAYPGLPASSRWEPIGPRADLNNDNTVDLRDLMRIAINFGKILK